MTDLYDTKDVEKIANDHRRLVYFEKLTLNGDDLRGKFNEDGRQKLGRVLHTQYATQAKEDPRIYRAMEELENKMREKGMQIPHDHIGHRINIAFQSWLYSGSKAVRPDLGNGRKRVGQRLI